MARLTLAALVALCLALPALAQERPDPKEEVARLESLLKEVEAALKKLEQVNNPSVTWIEYDCRALFRSAPDRHAPSLKLPTPDAGSQSAAGGAGGSLSFGEGSSGAFSFEDAEESGLEPDYAEDLLKAGFLEGHNADLQFAGGFLHLKTTAANHAIARSILTKLRQQRLRCVQVEVGIYSLPAELQASLERASLANGGILSAGALKRLDAAVARGEGKLVDAALLSSLSQQCVYFHRGAERSYVSSFERSSGGTGQIVDTVSDPIVDVLQTGLALEVRSSVLEGGRIVQLDLRCARSTLLGITRRSTPYGTIDVPRLQLTSTRTSTRVPFGAGVLVSATRTAAPKSKDPTKPQAKDKSVLIVVRPR
ncbi:MAG: hypothetical protein JKY65_20305 [Planctomycetes bacterium]|nr:hypothetical protein [Planctomycetota bacterium]